MAEKISSPIWLAYKKLNQVSPTFCVAKWLQTTLTLYNGETHSCHHCPRHKADLKQVADNPAKLHNTQEKLEQRREMLDGRWPAGCNYCERVETLPESHLSDRAYKATAGWAEGAIEKVTASGLGEEIVPAYLEVAFETTCNFKCVYCSPVESSRWRDEIERHGPYELSPTFALHDLKYYDRVGKLSIHRSETNPYVEAFWKWWPKLYPSLKVLRITGGEPLLSNHTWSIIEHIMLNPRPDLELIINSNLGVPEPLIDRLIVEVNRLVKLNAVKRFTLITSAEAVGAQGEYIRFGKVWNTFAANVERYLRETPSEAKLSFSVTHNVLACFSWLEFMTWLVDLKAKFDPNPKGDVSFADLRVWMMVNYLREPEFMRSTQLSSEQRLALLPRWKQFAVEHHKQGLSSEEVDMVNRLCTFIDSMKPDEKLSQDFWAFFNEVDRRRGTNINATFPELT